MNREIKFRAFHETEKVMYWFDVMNGNHGHGNGYIGMSHFGEDITKNRYRDNMRLVDPTECVIMQFTGLKDKNGVDIYEGDIVKTDFNIDGNHNSVQVIEFYEGSFGSRNKEDHFRIPALFSGRATEGMNTNYYQVIGNIHQNPELT